MRVKKRELANESWLESFPKIRILLKREQELRGS